MIKVSVHGAEGHMGRMVTGLVESAADTELSALFTEIGRQSEAGDFHPDLPLSPQDKLSEIHPRGGVIIDFSLAPALDALLDHADRTAAPLVIGTTGHTETQMNALRDYASRHPVVLASNFSVGIPSMRLILEKLADVLPADFMTEEIEIHHSRKIDKPSGTALTLAQAWKGRRGPCEVPIHSLRIGGITGQHTWIFSDEEETLEITHRAHSRRAFLKGVLPSVRFVDRAEPGLYGMEDVLSS